MEFRWEDEQVPKAEVGRLHHSMDPPNAPELNCYVFKKLISCYENFNSINY